MTTSDAANSLGTRHPAPSAARLAYENGMPVRTMRRRYHMSDSEVRDTCPEEFDDEPVAEPDGLGGY